MNKNYTTKVQDEIEKMLEAGIIFKVEVSNWVSLIVISLKKEFEHIQICFNFWCLNEVTIKDMFPIPFTNIILEEVIEHEMYSFLDGFSGHNQISIAKEYKLKTTFVIEDGCMHTTECHSSCVMHRPHSKESYYTSSIKFYLETSKHSWITGLSKVTRRII